MNQTKTCTTCHQTKDLTEFTRQKTGKYGVTSTCKCCIKKYSHANKERIAEYGKQHYIANKEAYAERKKQYYQDNQERIAEQHKQWHKDNPQYDKQYYQDNKEHLAELKKQYHKSNSVQIAALKKRYSLTPKGKAIAKADKHNRRAAKLNNGGKHTGAEILELFDLQSGKCPYCKTKLHKTKRNSFHVDHVMPLSKGGSNEIENLQLLCPTCNLSKHDKLPEEFAAKFNKLF